MCLLIANPGVNLREQGRHGEARENLQKALILAEQIGYKEQVCNCLLNLGGCELALENYKAARKYFQDALVLAQQLGLREWICGVYSDLATMAMLEEDREQAEVSFQEAIKHARQLGYVFVLATGFYEYGNMQLRQGRLDEAEALFRGMYTLAPYGAQELLALAYYGIARVMARAVIWERHSDGDDWPYLCWNRSGIEMRKKLENG
ncbi:tetratricopeptide repeat protein [Thermosporothrix hazakensis]|jgi:tetratricopeptide (TPR) repeat protein|uniref:Tetratricopeptide repeat protein n=1 Tax=Thermosporothrix hazakensis TaxID=644383 RepID=A0A326UD15_THEHA|nr:tetratricopeptide repeat protein [Thermosporothrix hazakensis]PZW36492.1 tetratricopeptide repeat protein [Thermosporothrix hazakensis]